MSNGFLNFTGVAAAMPSGNINTDAIIPIAWMRTTHADLGRGLFGLYRYDEAGQERADFVLNQEPFRKASILFAGDNFGCGSSREAAVWALTQFGIKCVFAPSFADIFYENAFRNSLVAGVVDKDDLKVLFDMSDSGNAEPVFSVDLAAATLTHLSGIRIGFQMAPSRRQALMRGDDEIGLTLQYADEIAAFHKAGLERQPWLHAPLKSKASS
jgi:3-isopropylmalate dehydratase small subunit